MQFDIVLVPLLSISRLLRKGTYEMRDAYFANNNAPEQSIPPLHWHDNSYDNSDDEDLRQDEFYNFAS